MNVSFFELRLLRLMAWMIRRVAPATRADSIVADLERDYRSHERGGAGRWLLSEGGSLLTAYARARLWLLVRRSPLVIRDIQLVLRGLRRGTLSVVASAALLSVGIAAVLITAGLVDALLLRQVSQSHGDALRRLVTSDPGGRTSTRLSLSELEIIRDHVGDAAQAAAVSLQPVVLKVNTSSVQTMAEVVEGPYFALTGMTTILGRGLAAADDLLGSAPVVVIAEPFWRRHLDASGSVLGDTLQLNGHAYTIVGVANSAGSSAFLGASVDAWVPASHADPLISQGWRTEVSARLLTAFVLPATDNAQLAVRLTGAAEELGDRHAEPWAGRRLHLADATVLVGSQRSAALTLAVVLGAFSLLILLSAASNVSGVLVARAAANQRSAAIHMSIGAGRALLVRRQLLEGALVGAMSGGLAMALYAWVNTAVAEVALLPTLALRLVLPGGLSMFGLSVMAGTVAGVLLSIAPAIWTARTDLLQAMRDDGRAGGGAHMTRVRRGLVSAQIGLSLVLIVGAAMFLRSLDALASIDLGFPRDRLVALDFDLEPAVRDRAELPAMAREALARVNAIPGVIASAMSNRAPVDQSTPTVVLQLVGDESSRISDVTMNLATEGYFDTVGIPLLQGRSFNLSEVDSDADVIIVNESLARRFWPDGDVLDRPVFLVGESRTARVIGVARDAKYSTVTESNRAHVYLPVAPSLTLTLLARTSDDSREALRAIQQQLDQVGPGVVGFFPRTMDDHLAVQLLPTRAAANAATVLGILALLLSAAALYALVAWFVVLRQREIGLRMALGASHSDVRRLVVGQAVVAAAPGLVLGLVLTVTLATLAQSILFGVNPADPVAIGGGVTSLLIIVLLAGYFPSRQATKVDPAIALRQ